jgi:hypothetical protein
MMSERQLRANRRNAQKSTGPKSRVGKKRAGQNAYRHGLGVGILPDPDWITKIEALAKLTLGKPDPLPTLSLKFAGSAQ